MIQLKIKEELWDAIVKGKKHYEYRKLSKGLTSGTYEFASIEHNKIYGTAELITNMLITKDIPHTYINWLKENLHKATYMFLVKNYINQHEFIEYEISNIKDLRNV